LSEADLPEIPLPSNSDELFGPAPDWQHNAVLGQAAKDWPAYGDGYLGAARRLADSVLADRHEQDLLVFPIAFLYRQYVEIRLKEILLASEELTGKAPVVRPTHDLRALWAEVEPVIRREWPKADPQPLSNAARLVLDFSKQDPLSFSFRYPVDKKGAPVVRGQALVNLRQLAETMEKLGSFFDGICLHFAERLEQLNNGETLQ